MLAHLAALGVVRAKAATDARNAYSQGLMARLGFAFTELVTGADAYKGAIVDERHYALSLQSA